MGMSRVRGKLRFSVKRPTPTSWWIVYWDNWPVANFQRPSQARTMAKRGNAWLRSLGNFSSIDVANMGNALTSFLADAATGDNGNYDPPLSTF